MTAPSPPVARAHAALVVAALLFGSTFVVVKEAVRALPPLAFIGWRFLLGAAILLAVGWPRSRRTWRDGILAGVVLFAGYALQTEGLARTSASNSGLVTGLYVVFTPLLASTLGRRRPAPRVLLACGLAFAGLALLTAREGLALATGDLLTVGCAVAFSGHLLVLSAVAPRNPVVALTGVQVLVVAVLGLASAAGLGQWRVPGPGDVLALVVTGVGVSVVAYLLQVWAQVRVGPSRTAVVLALEPAFAALFAAALLGERIGARGLAGAALILVAIHVALAAEPDVAPADGPEPGEPSAGRPPAEGSGEVRATRS